ncbi:MAG: 4-(cytidine 5'-diphospho)-2-C-methyl-D-erythritol kinase [Bacteroidales bacterium]|nr:4-(cytidine 5'-diphospho)-2-C-methyl-D-erythritol kinase [Bacteroidales bacterium]
MIGFPNAKINIGLKITGKFPDGYHEIKSLMIPTGFYDILEILPSRQDELSITGLKIPGHPDENILWKVLITLRENYSVPPLKIHLHKLIPTGAGLGGGSADASFFLKMLNELFRLGMGVEKLEKIVSAIGSDCPFFIRNQPALITGKGEKIRLFPFAKNNMHLVILYPGFPISTAQAYAGVNINPETTPLEELLKMEISRWKEKIENDFEKNLFPVYPELPSLKTDLYRSGAVYASMSGSGSAVYGIFMDKPVLPDKLRRAVVFEGNF